MADEAMGPDTKRPLVDILVHDTYGVTYSDAGLPLVKILVT